MKKNKSRVPNNSVNITSSTVLDNTTPDSSPIIPQRTKLKHDIHIIERPDFTLKQKKFIDLVLNKNTKMLFVSGPAGTAKSYLSIYCALKLLNLRRISDIVYVRSIVESADSKIGYLPGEIEGKVSPYMEPLYDKLDELLLKNEIDLLRKDQRIQTKPVSFLRGLNWNAKFIFADESQNMTAKELTTLITRTGRFSKVIVAGDPEQSDVNGKSGFIKMMNAFNDEDSRQHGIYTFEFTEEDIVRDELVKFIVKKLREKY